MAWLKENKWEVLVSLVFFIILVARWPADDMRWWFEYCFRISIGFLFACYLFTEVNKWAGILLVVATITHVYPNFTEESYIALDRLMIGLGLYALIVKQCTNTDIIINTIAVGAIIQSIFVITQHFGIDLYDLITRSVSIKTTDGEGLMANRNETSAFLAMTAPALFRKKWLFFLLLLLPAIYFANGLGGYVGFAAGIMAFSALSFHPAVVISIVVGAGLGIWYIIWSQNEIRSITVRWDVWTKAIKLWWMVWWPAGCGFGNWKVEALFLAKQGAFIDMDVGLIVIDQGQKVMYFKRLHNSFVEAFVEMGPAFLIPVLGYAHQIIRNCKKAIIPTSALAATFAMANINTIERMNVINMMLMILWAAVFQIQVKKSTQREIA